MSKLTSFIRCFGYFCQTRKPATILEHERKTCLPSGKTLHTKAFQLFSNDSDPIHTAS